MRRSARFVKKAVPGNCLMPSIINTFPPSISAKEIHDFSNYQYVIGHHVQGAMWASSRPGLLGKPIRPDRDARSASWAFPGGRNGGKEAGHRKAMASRQASRRAVRQAVRRAVRQAGRQASKQAGGQVARQGLTSNPTANGDLVSLIQKKTILCFNHYYTPPY